MSKFKRFLIKISPLFEVSARYNFAKFITVRIFYNYAKFQLNWCSTDRTFPL